MSFLNAALAFGALAFAIPLVIHLFFRSRFKTVEWGAMHLLDSVIRVNRKRMQWTNWLLLLLRCAIPILLAFCLARPVLTGFQTLAGDAPRTLVIALDDSRSMSARPLTGPSPIENAKEHLNTILGQLSRRDEVILVHGSRVGSVPTQMGVAEAIDQIRRTVAEGDQVSIGQLLEAARSAAAEGTHARRQILVVSDFQSNSVDSSTLQTARQIAATVDAAATKGTSDPPGDNINDQPVIDFLNVGGNAEQLANVSVDAIEVNAPVVVAGRSSVYTAKVVNATDKPVNDLRLIWSVNGKAMDPRVISIDENSSTTNRLTHAIDSDGVYEVTATINRSDALLADNTRTIGVEVIREVNVLLIDGKPSQKPLAGQADFLAIALSPFAFGGDDRPDPVRASVVRPDDNLIARAMKENDIRVVILAGVGKLSTASQSRIANFVARGGSLVMFDGPNVKSDLYNQPWKIDALDDESLHFPMRLGEIVGTPDAGRQDAGSSEGGRFLIDTPSKQYLAWQRLASGNSNPLADVQLSAYRKLLPPTEAEDSSTSASSSVLLRANGGAALAAIAPIGDGTVIQFAFPGTTSWSNLPLQPVFLPMIQQMVLDLAGNGNDSSIVVGQPIVVRPQDWPDMERQIQANKLGKVMRATDWATTPGGEIRLGAANMDAPLTWNDTFQPGTYRLRRRVVDEQDQQKSVTSQVVFVASVSPSESVLMDVPDDRLASLAGILNAKVFRDSATLQAATQTRSFGREVWRWLFVLLLVALVAELWLQQNLISRRTSSSAPLASLAPTRREV